MANWCSNTVVFEGEPEAIEQIQQLFKTMIEKQQQENCGQLPEFSDDTKGDWFFDIYQDDDVIGIFQYETKWSPNIEVVQKIAEHYKVDFVQEYAEVGNQIYGKATYSNGILDDVCLSDEDLEQYRYDEQTDRYYFENEEYESDCEILEILLSRKLAVL
ncbi:DUF1281 family ferredoxin-like fold protein [Sphingobacterium wenxiniae]|uniref:YubB ferredoxin-like domain-containing protein n=1 Tax=Sphingobacterium wenxiniae TaxID=683125 RepID=A0A1I6UUN8_9SPHI|nr:hypothetical protein [Sphingobacterium wenxiniae]SFT05188.1 hypothetical protein SAMN05660206_11050 [Sphingobacterium wenxiniae]